MIILVYKSLFKGNWVKGVNNILYPLQHAKKVVSNSPGLVDFAIGLANSVCNLPDRQVMFFEEFE